jgi:hypothetical protein
MGKQHIKAAHEFLLARDIDGLTDMHVVSIDPEFRSLAVASGLGQRGRDVYWTVLAGLTASAPLKRAISHSVEETGTLTWRENGMLFTWHINEVHGICLYVLAEEK